MKTDEKMYTPRQVATMFSVTPYTVRSWINRGMLKAVKLPNNQLRITQSALENFEKEQ